MQPETLVTAATINPKNPATPESEARSRHAITRKRRTRRRLFAAGGILAIGAIAGTGFAVNGVIASDAATRQVEQINATSGLRSEQLGVYAGIAKAQAAKSAKATIDAASVALASADGKVDAAPLAASVASLQGFELLELDDVANLTKQTQSQIGEVQAAVAEHERVEAAAAQLAYNNTPEGARALAREMAANKYGWGDAQFAALEKLWQKESGWSYTAYNASSGATGIPQSLPGSKMATAGADWETNAATQIAWGLDYIARGYGSPSAAWAHSQSVNWY